MLFNDFREIFNRKPFRPIRIFITSGETVDIRDPEQALISKASFAFAIGPKKGEIEEVDWYSLIHVVKVVPLSALRRRRSRSKRTA